MVRNLPPALLLAAVVVAALAVFATGCDSGHPSGLTPSVVSPLRVSAVPAGLALYVLNYGVPPSPIPESIDEFRIGIGGSSKLTAGARYGKGLFGPPPAISEISAYAIDAKVGLIVSDWGAGSISYYYRFPPGGTGSITKLFSPKISARKGAWPNALAFDALHDLVESDPYPLADTLTYNGITSKIRATLAGESFYPGLLGIGLNSTNDSFLNADHEVNEFAPFATSTSAPVRSIPEPSMVGGITVDSRGYVYALNIGVPVVQITITSPSNTAVHIMGPRTRLDLGSGSTLYSGPALDSSGRIYVARYDAPLCTCTGGLVTVLVFAPTARKMRSPSPYSRRLGLRLRPSSSARHSSLFA